MNEFNMIEMTLKIGVDREPIFLFKLFWSRERLII